MKKKPLSRRSFIGRSTLVGLGSLLRPSLIQGKALEDKNVESPVYGSLSDKHPELKILNDRPINAETPAHLLDDERTPASHMFVRNNGLPPETIDTDTWTLTVEGESTQQKMTWTLAELKKQFEVVSYDLTIECGGNGRNEFNPTAKGLQWSTGAVACGKWTGVRLKDVLNKVGLKEDAVYIGYYGADTHISGDPTKTVISRGVPIWKALQEESIIAWSYNDEDIPVLNGYPLRLVFGGWPGSTSGKWLNRIVVRNQEHDGQKMGGQSYRVPKYPVSPGSKVADEDMVIIESMPVKSLITAPKSGAVVNGDRSFEVRGHAWAGENQVTKVDISIDFGTTWTACELFPPKNRLAWQRWKSTVRLPQEGYYEIWVRATDDEGRMQPMIVPGWNPKGYLNNACHRIAVKRKG